MAAQRGARRLGALGLLCLLLPAVLGEDCEAYADHHGKAQPAESCPNFCCGDCMRRYCCSNVLLKFDEGQQFKCNLLDGRTSGSGNVNYLQFRADFDDYIDSGPRKVSSVALSL
ncbi:protein shisa-4-like isoform X2 [Dromaius novaehollandiae]|uniref:protein shisa-4-like isoform X1 n=1 Tax=Dromaius novaehollandiae TaxID=8790 RepID=UPI00311EEE49